MFIGFKAKDGTVLKFGYGYENEIVPEFKIPDDLADLLKVKKIEPRLYRHVLMIAEIV